MSRPEHNYLPVVPDALEAEEFLGIVIEDGRELGRRERIDARPTFDQALADAQRFAARCNRSGPGTAYPLVLRRALGPWEPANR
ncbi:MAG TPA: hypothetical protein VED41_07165 [Solirubrobacteraceae bacterium]|nr:hypothetical protein [Solirubrobacteraceae bacterium]